MAQDIADFLESKRKEKHMNHTDFAKLLGMAQSNYSRMISNKTGITKTSQKRIIDGLSLEGEDLTKFQEAVKVSGGRRPDKNIRLSAEELQYLARIADVSGPLPFNLMLQHIKLYRSRQ